MADITMCAGVSCPKKEECYRYKATPSNWQSYFCNVPYDQETRECEMFLAMEDKKDG